MLFVCVECSQLASQEDASAAVDDLLKKYSAAAGIDASVRACVEDRLVQVRGFPPPPILGSRRTETIAQ